MGLADPEAGYVQGAADIMDLVHSRVIPNMTRRQK